MHQLFITASLQLLRPVIQTIFFFGVEIFNPQGKKSAKIKCHLFRPKPQKLPVIRYVIQICTNELYLSWRGTSKRPKRKKCLYQRNTASCVPPVFFPNSTVIY